jgi:phosphatidylserine/phosphatidylglycerophosphate/cardiolipin synthase-like enzyme
VEILVGLDLPTAPAALDELLAWSCAAQKVTVRVWTTKTSYFHPKVYLIQQEREWIAYVGSANCTVGGWEHNEELTVRVDTPAASSLRQEWFAPRFAEGVTLTADFAAAYRAAFTARATTDAAARAAALAAQQEWQGW